MNVRGLNIECSVNQMLAGVIRRTVCASHFSADRVSPSLVPRTLASPLSAGLQQDLVGIKPRTGTTGGPTGSPPDLVGATPEPASTTVGGEGWSISIKGWEARREAAAGYHDAGPVPDSRVVAVKRRGRNCGPNPNCCPTEPCFLPRGQNGSAKSV